MEQRLTVTPVGLDQPALEVESGLYDLSGKDELADHLRAMLAQEANGYPTCKDYLSILKSVREGSGEVVNETWRRKLCEWCYEVVDHFSFDREAVSIAMDFLDRTVAAKVQTGEVIGRRDYQLLAVTSLFMALKIHGESDASNGPRRKLRISSFVELSRGFFSVDAIQNTESEMLSLLNWRLNPPTHYRFVASILRLCPRWTAVPNSDVHTACLGPIFDIARYLTELSVCLSSFSFDMKRSTVAYAACLCGIEARGDLPYHARIKFQNNVAECMGLYPSDPEVRRAQASLKELCPNMFQPAVAEDFSSSSLVGDDMCAEQAPRRTSPVSVVVEESSESGKKRSRPHESVTTSLHRSNF